MKTPLYCPTRTFRWRAVLGDSLVNKGLPKWPQLDGAEAIAFYQGKVALWFLCELWQLQPGDEVLMPAYNCGSEVDPFHAYGTRVVFYRVDERARIDGEDLKSRCTSRTRIVYITHYFGWPQSVASVCRWCREKGIRVVEDCALSLFSVGGEGPLGTLADASLFSFRKTLPVPDGAALVLRDGSGPSSRHDLRKPPLRVTLRNLRPFVKSSLLDVVSRVGAYSYLRRRRMDSFDPPAADKSDRPERPDMPPNYYFDRRMRNWTMSSQAAGVLSRTEPASVVERRRRNYHCLLQRIRGMGLQMNPLFDTLPEGVCPLGVVLLTSHRSTIVRTLHACGIAAFAWWQGYHRDFDWSRFPEAGNLKDNALFLPISQTMDERHMAYIGDCLRMAGSVMEADQEHTVCRTTEHG
ncbi:MAG: DegT/DnrJ/EryC1/StrS aminotransferase family protein [Phycisphaerae bacterium]|nr:DegT/DnrJ/EryC1/StrS aminotransferase family protein [Phycisphaerae bacterium]